MGRRTHQGFHLSTARGTGFCPEGGSREPIQAYVCGTRIAEGEVDVEVDLATGEVQVLGI